jgi:anti-sigma-K factor RskA
MTPDHVHADHERFDDWDAGYVLGALSPAERREFEAHLESCERCRSAVAELTMLPGLLGRLDAARAFELLESDGEADAASTAPASAAPGSTAPAPPPPAELVARIGRREHQRRSRRIRALIGLAAAAVLAAAIAIPVAIASAPHPTLATALSQVVTSPLSADVTLTSVGWGTKVEMSCHYGEAFAGTSKDARWNYALWVVSRDGASSELSSWSAKSETTVNLTAGTAVPVDQIAEVQVRSDDGTVLLQSQLTG